MSCSCRLALPLAALALLIVVSCGQAAEPTDIPDRTPTLQPVAPPEQRGPVWPIAEEDLRTTILTRLQAKLPEIKAGLAQGLRAYRVPSIERPTTDAARTLTLDPSFELEEDVVTPDGQLVARAGDRINLLDRLPFRRTYLLINAADPRQLAWAARQVRTTVLRPMTVLLTEGNLQDAAAALPPGTPLAPAPLDLFARYPIDSVPARLARSGSLLRLDLIPERDLE